MWDKEKLINVLKKHIEEADMNWKGTSNNFRIANEELQIIYDKINKLKIENQRLQEEVNEIKKAVKEINNSSQLKEVK